MKNASAFTERLKKLFSKLKKAGGEVTLDRLDDPMEQLLVSVLSNYASESRARAAVARLREETVDLNDLRVTPIADIVQMIGVDYPHCRSAATEIFEALGALFNRTHELSLSFLKPWPRKATDEFLDSLGVLSPHTKAGLVFRCLGGHIIPLDEAMHRYLVKAECVPEDMDVEQSQKFISTRIKERDAAAFYVLLKKYAATHAPKKLPQKKRPEHAKAATTPAPAVSKVDEPGSDAGGEDTMAKAEKVAKGAKKKASTKTRAAQAAAKKEAARKTAAKKKTAAASKGKSAKKEEAAKVAPAKRSAEKKAAVSKSARTGKKTSSKKKARKTSSKTKRSRT